MLEREQVILEGGGEEFDLHYMQFSIERFFNQPSHSMNFSVDKGCVRVLPVNSNV